MRLLIVGSLGGHMTEAAHVARARGTEVSHVETIEAALVFMRRGGADVVFIDVSLDVGSLIENLLGERITTPIMACGIGNEISLATRAIKAGAKEYIPLPPDADFIAAVLETISTHDNQLVYKDPVMARVITLAEQIAKSEASVLITGESGTGKEVIARFIHQKSKRCQAPFISVNCAAIPENLLESELFGHEKGAFTGALARRIGKFEEANGGTLLLDEVTEMHPRLQAKLLRAIQEREIDRVGGNKPVKVNIRLLATSNRDMEAAVKEGIFREDLYFRLNVVAIRLPALRERREDIPALADYFVDKYVRLNGASAKLLHRDVYERLKHMPWRGNVRELENVIHRAVLLSTTPMIGIEDLQISPVENSEKTSEGKILPAKGLIGKTVAEVEKDLILNTLLHCSGNRTHAATILGISIRTLRNKLRQYRDAGEMGRETQLDHAC